MAETVASASDLTVRYGAKTILDSFSIEIPEGCIGLLGPNGAGKSTLIKTFLGFVTPAGGRATVLGMDVAGEGRTIRQRVGLMPEQECHIPGMNAVTFVAYAGELAGLPQAQALRRSHEVLEYCGLGEARYRNVETFSTGMKQRVKLAQALVHGPRLLFLDEPTNGLDPQGRDEMLELVRDVSHGKGLSVVICSHLLPDIERTCDEVIVLRGGKVVTRGPIELLKTTEDFQMNVEVNRWSDAFGDAVTTRGAAIVFRHGETVRLSWPTKPADPGRMLFESARESGVQVRGLRAAERSLEDIFLEAVEA